MAALTEIGGANYTIERQLHCVLDVPLNENAAREIADKGLQNLTVLRKIAAKILRAKPNKGSLNCIMKRAGCDDT